MFSTAQQPATATNRTGSTGMVRATLAGVLMAAAGTAGAATYWVTQLNDSGTGSLREAVALANDHQGADSIAFRGRGIIRLGSILPPITDSAGLTIDGGSQDVTISGNNAVPVMAVKAGGKLELKNLTIADGNGFSMLVSPRGTAGIDNSGTLVIRNSILSGHHGQVTGAVYNSGSLTIDYSTVSASSGGFDSGGIGNAGTLTLRNSTVSGNSGDRAGGVSNSHSARLTVSNSTFSGNSSHFIGAIQNGGVAVVTNSTFTANSGVFGAGALSNGGILTLINSTVAGNSGTPPQGPNAPGGIYNGGTLTLANTILASNAHGDCRNFGTIHRTGVNWMGDGSCGLPKAGDPLLAPLADNGGPTQTRALLPGSPAIDAGSDLTCRSLDQRGIKRPQGSHCDIGAFEKSGGDFAGFNSPIGNPPELNEMKAGQVVPLRFRMSRNQYPAIFQSPYPVSKQIDCGTDQLIGDRGARAYGKLVPERTGYTFVWQTDPAWAGTCRQFQILFADGGFRRANFTFK